MRKPNLKLSGTKEKPRLNYSHAMHLVKTPSTAKFKIIIMFFNHVILQLNQLETTIEFKYLNYQVIQTQIQNLEIFGIALYLQPGENPKNIALVELVNDIEKCNINTDLHQMLKFSIELNALSSMGVDIIKNCRYYFSDEYNRNETYINLFKCYPELISNRITIPSM